MPKVKDTTITDKKIAEYFNLTQQTLGNWKRSNDNRLHERYKALKEYLIKINCS